MKLIDLAVDCLLKIFNYCDLRDLKSLSAVHPRFRVVIEDVCYKRTLNILMCGHRNNPAILYRTHSHLSYVDRLQISNNWLHGCYDETQYFRHPKMFTTVLHLEQDYLYVSYGRYLNRHKRLDSEPLQRHYDLEITTTKSDIACFVKKGDSIFVGDVNSLCFVYEDGYTTVQQLHRPGEYLKCLDFIGNMYATSSERSCKIWRREEEFGVINLEFEKKLTEAFKTLRFDDSGCRLYGGLYTAVNRRALREIDLESGEAVSLNSDTISIYDLKLKDENTLFTAHFDTSFRLYDRRSDRDELIWEDPFDSSFYCLEHDGLYAVLCGTKYHSRVNLYDIRVPKKHMQLFFPHNNQRTHGFQSSPVYNLACDSRYLFVATDRSVSVFDFKVDYFSGCKDYRDVFGNKGYPTVIINKRR